MTLSGGFSFRVLTFALAALIGLQMLIVGSGAIIRARDIQGLSARPMIAQAAAAAELVERTAPQHRITALRAMSSPYIRFSLVPEFPDTPEIEEPLPRFRPIIRSVRAGLGDRAFRLYQQRRRPWFAGRDAAGRLHASEILLVMRLSDGAGLAVEPSAVYQRHVVMNYAALLSATAGLILLAALIWAANATSRPLREMAAAANRLARDWNAPPVPERGPRLVRELAEAFNEMQRALQHSLAERTRTLAAIAHDMRTYLTRLRLRAEFIADDVQREKANADFDDVSAIIDDAILLARSDVETRETCDPGSIVEEMVRERREMGQDVVLTDAASGGLRTRGRRADVKRAIDNLVDNAIRFGARARLAVRQSDRTVVVFVNDDGPGAPADQIERLSEPFYRLEDSRSRDTGGSGLGLSIVKRIAESYGGSLRIRNAEQGGLEARFALPIA